MKTQPESPNVPTTIRTVNSPVGCSTLSVFSRPGGIRATAAAGEPGSTQAVATVTAAKTPIEAWHSCGMKLRVQTSHWQQVSPILPRTPRRGSRA